MSECSRCLLPAGKFNVTLDADGICNYCRCFERHQGTFLDFEALRPRMEERFDRVRGKYEYDAIVGLSGGKDSTYIAYKLVREHGLKVLGITYDNGFLTDFARRSIQLAVDKLAIPHEFYYPRREIHDVIFRAGAVKTGDPCVGCAIPAYFLATKLGVERRIPFFVHGRSPYQMFRNFYEGSRDAFLPMMWMNIEEHSFERVAMLHARIDQQVRGWLGQLIDDPEARERVYREFFCDPSALSAEFAPESLGYFLFYPYDEEAVKRELERELGWERPGNDDLLSHSDCEIADISARMFADIHGISMVALEAAAMLRFGAIEREQARALIARSVPDASTARDSARHLCGRLQLTEAELEGVVTRLREAGAAKFDSH